MEVPPKCSAPKLNPISSLQLPPDATQTTSTTNTTTDNITTASTTAKAKRPLPDAFVPSPKRSAASLPSCDERISPELGKLIDESVVLLKKVGWQNFVQLRRKGGDFSSLNNIHHPAKRLLKHLKHRGAPVKFTTPPWSRQRLHDAISRGPHQSCQQYIDFLDEEFISSI